MENNISKIKETTQKITHLSNELQALECVKEELMKEKSVFFYVDSNILKSKGFSICEREYYGIEFFSGEIMIQINNKAHDLRTTIKKLSSEL